MKKSGVRRGVLVYKGSDPGGQNGNSGLDRSAPDLTVDLHCHCPTGDLLPETFARLMLI